MLIDRPQVSEGSVIVNATVPSGTSYPTSPNSGELFFRTDLNALHAFTGVAWVEAGKTSLDAHIADATLHLSSFQNALFDGIAPSITSSEINFLDGVTSSIQDQITAVAGPSGTLAVHMADDTRHLTASQNTLIDAIVVSSTELNYVTGANAPLQGQINTINALDGVQNTRLTTLENTTVPAVQTNLNTHMADDARHLTASQNTLIDAITVTAADINKLSGAAGLTSSIKLSLDQLASSDYSAKISANGSIGMSGNLALGGNRITGLGMPLASSDAATKDYVDSFVQGLHWVGSVKAASTGNLVLNGFQTVDGVALANSDRVLIKDQNTAAENGIYLVASGAWSRSNDFNLALEINNSAVFVLAGGASQGKSTWVQTAVVTNLGSDTISFSAFSGPVINQAGGGVTLGSNGLVSVKEGAGLAFDGNNALIVDVFAGGGLMITTNNTTAATLTTSAAQIALTQSGVTAAAYGSVTQSPTFTVDAKGRITIAANATITPAFTSITGLPITLAGYGITNAVLKTGDTMSGNLMLAPSSGIAELKISRATAASGQTTLSLTTVSGAGAGTWQLYNQTGTSNFAIYSSILGSDVMQLSTTGSTNFTGSVQATSFIGSVTGNAATVNMSSGRTDTSPYPVIWGTTGSTSQLYSASNVTIQSSTGTLAAVNFIGTGQSNFQGSQASGIATSTGALGGIMIQGNGTNAAFMSFHRPGAFAAYLGLDTDNQFAVGGWSMGASRFVLLHSGNFNLYSPTLNGVGSSGTWPINITGNASNSNTVGGYAASVGVVANTLVLRDGNGYLMANYLNSTDNSQSSGVSAIMVKAGDNYLRSGTAAAVASFVGPSITALGNIATMNGVTPPNGLFRMTPNFHINTPAGNAVILNWDNGAAAGNPQVRIGNGFSVDAWQVLANGNTIQTGSISTTAIFASSAITGSVLSVQSSGVGYINIQRGNGGATGYVEFVAANGNRQGYIGFSGGSAGGDTGTLNYVGGSHVFSGSIQTTAQFNGSGAGLIGTAGSLSIGGNSATANLAAKASTLAQSGGNGAAMTFNWSGQSGQPPWLWGSNDGVNHYVYNPSNFNVNYANAAGSASTASTAALASNATSISNAVGGSYQWTGTQNFLSSNNTSIGGQSGVLVAYGNAGATNAATMSFHRPGQYAINMGLDSDNVFRIGGWSAAASRLQLDMSGNLTMAGDVIAYSDRRLKTDIEVIEDPLQKIEQLNGVTFKRIDSGETSIGLIAQDVEAVLPQAVTKDADGMLAVKYGNLAGLFVEAIKALNREVAELRAELKALKDTQ